MSLRLRVRRVGLSVCGVTPSLFTGVEFLRLSFSSSKLDDRLSCSLLPTASLLCALLKVGYAFRARSSTGCVRSIIGDDTSTLLLPRSEVGDARGLSRIKSSSGYLSRLVDLLRVLPLEIFLLPSDVVLECLDFEDRGSLSVLSRS